MKICLPAINACLVPILILLLCIAENNGVSAQVKLTEKDWVLPTYPVAPPDKNPIFFRQEAYQGASRHYYPLFMNDQYRQERIEQAWKTLVLENEYIELGVMPDIGGKLYYATDKTNGYHFIYKNNVVKPSNIGMTGAWVSGGIEWCVLHHHRASTFRPVDYATRDNEDGSKTIIVGESEPRHGMRWSIAITLRPGCSYFEVEGTIHNSSPFTHTFLNWANVAAHANENYQTIFPPSAGVVTYHSKTSFTTWPVASGEYTGKDLNGIDISWWKNVVSSNSFFVHDLREDFMGGYDHGKNAGTVHVGDHHIVKGAKLWEWGSGPRGQATERRLTESDGPYVELMTGAYSDNQPDYSWIRPYEVKTWKQHWYPVRGIKGFKNANLNGAVNLEKGENGKVFLGYYSTRPVRQARFVLKAKERVVYDATADISPEKPFAKDIFVGEDFEMTDLSTSMTDANGGKVLLSYRPVAYERVKELPEPVKGYPSPDSLKSVEELYLTGSRVEQFHSPRNNPMDWYNEALRRDQGDIRTNTAVGHICLKNGDYEKARHHFAVALKRLTRDHTRPSAGEAFYLQGLTLKALGLYEEAVDTLYRATWDYAWHSAAYYQLAQISVRMGDMEKALAQAEESIMTNGKNNNAIALKASILRRLGRSEEALALLKKSAASDLLDFRMMNERYLSTKASDNSEKAPVLLAELTALMRDNDQNYLELAVGYLNDGLAEEAGEVLRRYGQPQPLIEYYLGYIADLSGRNAEAANYFKSASGRPTDYIFPYRLKSIEILERALKHNPQDAKAWYYLGNVLFEKQPALGISHWEKAVQYDPSLSIAWRNLGWGYYRHYNDGARAIENYEKAISLNKNEPLYFEELDALYEMSNAPVEKRLALFDGQNEVVRQRDEAFIRQISVLILAGEAEKALRYLEGTQFAYREGASRVREVTIDAHMLSGMKKLEERKYEQALGHFLGAAIQGEEAGSARWGNRDFQVNYFTGLAYEASGKVEMAKEHFRKAISNESGRMEVMHYYEGLALWKSGQTEEAKRVFEKMVEEAEKNLTLSGPQQEYGVIFGEREAENARKSHFLTLRGLGYKGLKKSSQAKEDLSLAVELSHSNLWAKIELNDL